MQRFVIAPAALLDLESILDWSRDRFGDSARVRYENLIRQAMIDVAVDPDRSEVEKRSDVHADARIYRLIFSRDRAAPVGARVRHSRHLSLFRVRSEKRSSFRGSSMSR